jgi:hypothetical protein
VGGTATREARISQGKLPGFLLLGCGLSGKDKESYQREQVAAE